jgi:hypothetical protein
VTYLFLTSTVDEVSGQRHAPVALYPRERIPGSHRIGSLRTGLYTEATGKILCLCRASNPGRPVRTDRATPSYLKCSNWGYAYINGSVASAEDLQVQSWALSPQITTTGSARLDSQCFRNRLLAAFVYKVSEAKVCPTYSEWDADGRKYEILVTSNDKQSRHSADTREDTQSHASTATCRHWHQVIL